MKALERGMNFSILGKCWVRGVLLFAESMNE